MPRRPRIKLAEVPQQFVQRGINREPCFFADEDYHCYLQLKAIKLLGTEPHSFDKLKGGCAALIHPAFFA